MGIMEFIVLLGVVQGLILGGVLLTLDRGNRAANRVLGLVMILFSITISTHVVLESDFYRRAPHLLGIGNPIVFLFGPLFLLYTRLQISGPTRIKRRFLWHFLPFGLCLAYWTPFYLSSGADKILRAKPPIPTPRLWDI